MSETEMTRRQTWRLIGAALVLAVGCLAVALLALRSAAHAADEPGEIPDDPVVAPDPHQSADNNVSFPTDI
jgi:hypothetical protein